MKIQPSFGSGNWNQDSQNKKYKLVIQSNMAFNYKMATKYLEMDVDDGF